ncbi:UbiA prenyltransferase family-domain-containing protein [Butyriboletus roseoflavus]|nr:UbiA prenyltransferase family-domain-containing protein [Butyriboletus roseoflavus]
MRASNSHLQISDFLYHLHTLFLFTKADIRTALIPQTIFALAAAPVCHPSHVIHVVAWMWLHLLTCNIANQIKAPDEDKINKPFRPLPSGRISEGHARMLRWILVPVCLAVSAAYSTELFFTSLDIQILTVLYSELRGDAGFLLKNSLTGLMYGCAGSGGALLAVCDRSHVPKTAQLAVQLSMAVFASTLHAQDFKDVSGDRLTGRCTFPIAFPFLSRLSVALGIPLWSICLSHVWHLDLLSSTAFLLYSSYTGVRFMLYRSIGDDKRSCKFYSVSACCIPWEWCIDILAKFWLSIHHVLPGYWHICMAICNLRFFTPPSWHLHL